MADSIFQPMGNTPSSTVTAVSGWNAWYCSICGVRKPDPALHTQWHADLAAYMKSTAPTYATTQPTVAGRLGLAIDFGPLLTALGTILRF